jgi:hypothetical protein
MQPLFTPLPSEQSADRENAILVQAAHDKIVDTLQTIAKGGTFEEPTLAGHITGYPVVCAFQSAMFAIRAVRGDSSPDVNAAQLAAACVNWAQGAAAQWAVGSETKFTSALRQDIDGLRALAARNNWTNETPVTPETLGSIWPEGEPERWSSGGDDPLRAQVAVKPVYLACQPNEAIPLYEGPLVFRTAVREFQGTGAVTFVWLPTPTVVFAMRDVTPSEVVPHLGAGTLELPTQGFAFFASVSDLEHQVGPERVSLALHGYAVDSPTFGIGGRLSSVVFHLANFHSYLRPRPDPTPPDYDIHRTTFEAEGWRVVLEAVENTKDLTASLSACAGCAFTHAGRVEKVDGSDFDAAAVTDVLDALYYFFSFARGQWCPALLPVGFDAQGNRLWERWDARQTSDWRFRHSWFPEHGPDCLAGIFPGFLRKWKDADWNQTLRVAIHWYIESNAQAGAIEGAVVLQQLAFELLSSRVFVEERRTYTEVDFGKAHLFPAVRKMQLLLAEANISPAIPANLLNLSAHAQQEGWQDGPHALTRLRNCITHPTGRNRQTLDCVSVTTRVEAFNLALWYLELILLWLVGYTGPSVNRLTVHYRGDQEVVPWAPNPPNV